MRDAFPSEGSGLQRYATRFDAVEVNATFYRPPRDSTLQRWAESVGEGFRFSLKMPKAISHEARLVDIDGPLDAFLRQARLLGDTLGPLLLQLPPSLAFDAGAAGRVFRQMSDGGFVAVCEPRHATWFTPEADAWLATEGVARVAADPALHPGAGDPGGWRGLTYRRLHGSPRVYRSAYDDPALTALAQALRSDPAGEHWCIFDNTASGAATANALTLAEEFSSI